MEYFVVVGDPHITPAEIEDGKGLVAAVCALRARHTDKHLTNIWLGDLHHTHSQVFLEVMDFWRWAFESVGNSNIVLTGNHDIASTKSTKTSALSLYDAIFEGDVEVVTDNDWVHPWNNLYIQAIAYCPDAATFQERLSPKAHLVFAHQSFKGAKLENGYYDPQAIDAPDCQVISGHIHRPQKFDKVWYPGAPRWRTASDVNERRAIYLIGVDENGYRVIDQENTELHCRALYEIDIKTDADLQAVLASPLRSQLRPKVSGAAEWVKQASNALAAAGVKARSSIVQERTKIVTSVQGALDLAIERQVPAEYRAAVSQRVRELMC